jgi:hypothetical protein
MKPCVEKEGDKESDKIFREMTGLSRMMIDSFGSVQRNSDPRFGSGFRIRVQDIHDDDFFINVK